VDKVEIGTQVSLPMPVVLLGTVMDGRPNFMAVGWAARANTSPPMVTVGLNKRHHTPLGIEQNGCFSINFPGVGLAEKVDYCGLVSGRKTDKSSLFTLFYGSMAGAPMIEECQVCLECRVTERLELPDHWLFVGEIVAAYADPACLVEGRPDPVSVDPLLLTMPDNTCWRLGERVGRAWSMGRNAVAASSAAEEE
jgi:flavin reductase (DIM6/NTAB) family NADH-FMN oxidoreductase RutF